jgi:hypothetical protein
VCNIYDTGSVYDDFTKNVIVSLRKKAGAGRCEDYRTISLISHASKILTKIIYRRIEGKVEEKLSDYQFGFRKNRGTRDTILAL